MKELDWLPECNPNTNIQMEKLGEGTFSGVLTVGDHREA
jgi:hypothetical protein